MATSRLKTKVREFITHNNLLDDEHRLLLAVSGGLDSMVLLHLLHGSGYRISAAHCNFCLRGEESDDDEKLVESWCSSNSIPFFSRRFDVKAASEKNGRSIQMNAREMRYEWFGLLMQAHGFDRLCTAHHADDQAETLIMNLVTGKGPWSMEGIRMRYNKTVRPLLSCTKNELALYAVENGVQWREDSSNESNDYLRNYIRMNVIPVLKEAVPALASSSLRYSRQAADVMRLAGEKADDYLSGITEQRGDMFFVRHTKLTEHPSRNFLLRRLLLPYGFSNGTIDVILDSDLSPGSVFLSEEFRMVCDREHLVLEKTDKTREDIIFHFEKDQSALQLYNGMLRMTIKEGSLLNPKEFRGNSAALDAGLLQFPLEIRHWHPGDSFIPLGMEFPKKLSDYFIDRKTPLPEKNRKWIVLSEGKIAWIAGERIDQRFRITEKTKQAAILTWEEKHDS